MVLLTKRRITWLNKNAGMLGQAFADPLSEPFVRSDHEVFVHSPLDAEAIEALDTCGG